MTNNILDNIIGYINPKAGIRRVAARRSYEAASHGRRAGSFKGARSTGANLEIGTALVTLRNRSRHFVRNNGWAKRAIDAIVDNTVGEGIRPAPIGTRNQVKKIKKLWSTWAETTMCDYDGKSTIYGLQNLIMREIAEAGDCLIVRRRTKDDIPIKLQVLEGDQLDQMKDTPNEMGYARLGVQFDNEGKRLGYWIFKKHPNDLTGNYITLESEFISVDDIIHPFEIMRAGQVRGIPMGVASFMKMADFSDYEDAQLMRQKIAASFCAFVSGTDAPNTDDLEMLAPGIIEYLKDGEQITFANPPKADGYAEYSAKILQGIAASYGVTYEMLTMDYSNVNFTSGRMAKIDVSKRFRSWQYNLMVPQVCVPVWQWFMNSLIMVGKSATFLDCNAMDWTAPRVQQLDPVKETNARVLQVQSGFTTLSEIAREDGRDADELFEEIKQEREKLKEMGIIIDKVTPIEENGQKDPQE